MSRYINSEDNVKNSLNRPLLLCFEGIDIICNILLFVIKCYELFVAYYHLNVTLKKNKILSVNFFLKQSIS